MEIREEIRGTVIIQICHTGKGLDAEEIKDHFRIQEDLGIDSVDKNYLMFHLEDHFTVTFKDFEVESCKTVGDIVDLIQKKTGVS